jgi:hypothetical protein
MSLIQVSSNSKRESNNLTQQEGCRFSNIFNGVMEVPPFSEIALHSGQFTIDTGGGVVNFEALGGDNGNQYPAIRFQLAPTTETYIADQERIVSSPPSVSTTTPLLYFVPRKKFATIEQFWTEMVEYLKLDPRPQLQATYTEEGTQLSGISVDTLTTNSTQTPTFTIKSNIAPVSTSIISGDVFKKIVLGTDDITINAITGTITKSAGSQGKATQPSSFYTQSNGIHNGGGELAVGGFILPSLSAKNNTLNEMVIGIKRWGYKNTRADMSSGWAEMSSIPSYTEELKEFVIDNQGEPPAGYSDTLVPCLSSTFMFNQGGYGLSTDCVCEYAFLITGKTTGLGANSISTGWTNTPEQMCCNIMKYETGSLSGSSKKILPRWVMIATGDPMLNNVLLIPYSKQLDPESDLASWDGINMVSALSTGVGGATDNKFVISGNKVSFVINGQVVNWKSNVATPDVEAIVLTDFISDAVYPLQASGTIYKTGNSFRNVRISATGTQKEVKYFGKTYQDYAKYKANRQIIPAEIYNRNFNEITPRSFYPITDPARGEPTSIGVNTQSGAIEADTFLYLDSTQDGDAQQIYSQVNYQPNIKSLVGSTDARISFVSEDEYDSATNSYSVDVIQNPMLIGLYVRLKNLTQKTTMGSINSVDNDKLIAVVNRYDHTNDEGNLTGFPIYSYNEYDRLYVALNNPSPLYLSQLDFEIVDKFGNVISAVKNTSLVLHLRPATYRDLYGYKKISTPTDTTPCY